MQTVRDNFSWLSENKDSNRHIENAIIYEAAKLAYENEKITTPTEAHEFFVSVSGENYTLSLFTKFCKELSQISKSEDNETSSLSPAITVYVRNPLTDKAYEVFAREYQGLRAIYSHDFKSACEDVYYDRADSCIMPLESSSDGLLMPFRSMLIKYELKIAAVTKVISGEDAVQSLALVTGGETNTRGNVLEAYLPSVKQKDFIPLCTAVNEIGCDIIRVTTTESLESDHFDHHICFTSDSNSLSVLKYFLNGKYPAHIILGQYKNQFTKGISRK